MQAPYQDTKRLVVAVSGREKQGKTSFALSAPAPIIYYNFDIGAEGVIDKYADVKDIYEVKYRTKVFGAEQSQVLGTWLQFKDDYKRGLESQARTLVIDTGSEAWETNRLARLGKLAKVLPHQYTEVNAEHKDLLMQVFDTDKNLVLLHKEKPLYLNDKRTDQYEAQCFSGTPFIAQAICKVYRDPKTLEFMLEVADSRRNPDLKGLSLPISDIHAGFGLLYSLIYGEEMSQ